MPRYNPKDAVQCIPEGTYDSVIELVEDTTTKNGDEMQKVLFHVYDNHGRERKHWEYFTFGQMLFRYKKIARALGQEDAFKAGTFDLKDFQGKNLRLELVIEEGKNGYEDQNRAKEFHPPGAVQMQSRHSRVNVSDASEDDLPF